MLRRKHFPTFEQFYMTDTDKKHYYCTHDHFQLFTSEVLQRKAGKRSLKIAKDKIAIKYVIIGIIKKKKKAQLWGKPRKLQEVSLVTSLSLGTNTHQSYDVVFLIFRAFLS